MNLDDHIEANEVLGIRRAARATVVINQGTGLAAIGKGALLLHIATSAACRVRLYSTAAGRTADAARLATVAPPQGVGLLLEFVSTAQYLGAPLSPAPLAYNGDSPAVGSVYYNVQPVGATAAVTLSFLTLEGAAVAPAPPAPAGHTFWRVWTDGLYGVVDIAIQNVELRGVIDGPDLTTPADALTKALAGGSFSNTQFPARHAFDSDMTSLWVAFQQFPAWIGWQFDTPVDIVQYQIRVLQSTESLPQWVFQFSDDGISWTPAEARRIVEWIGNSGVPITKTFTVGVA